MLEIEIKEKRFDTILFENFRMKLPQFGLFAVTGNSGCGKSTLLNMIALMDLDYQGEIRLKGKEIDRDMIKQYITYVSSSTFLLNDLKVKEYLYMFKVEQDPLIDFDIDLKIGKLSRGQKQRLMLISALSMNKPILLCDEITSGLDEINKRKVLEILKGYALNHLVILVDHDVDLVSCYTSYLLPLKSNVNYDYTKELYDCTPVLFSYDRIKKGVKKYRKSHYYFLMLSTLIVLISMITLYLGTSTLYDQVIEQVNRLFPEDTYSFYSTDFTPEMMQDFSEDQFVYLCLDNAELIGISYENEIYYIDDYSSDIRSLSEGSYPKEDQEVVIGEKIAEALELNIGDPLIVKYLIDGEECLIEYKISGIGEGREIYFKEFGEYRYLSNSYNVHSSYALVEIKNQTTFKRELENCSLLYQKVGETLSKKVEEMIHKINILVMIGGIIGLTVALIGIIEIISYSIKVRERLMAFCALQGFKDKEIRKMIDQPYLKRIAFVCLAVHLFFIGVIQVIDEITGMELIMYLDFNYYMIIAGVYFLEMILLLLNLYKVQKKGVKNII